jgi:hypothetical protein
MSGSNVAAIGLGGRRERESHVEREEHLELASYSS